ncbi:hypothetical protein HanPI659440_Chr02g0082531 [Helianthus annuus]|nr:hypothetical protein HanPI659440_Chr02g0082531 [Helianthus annuus]
MQENIFEWQFAIRGPNDTKFEGALGSLDYKKEERRDLAVKSRETALKFGSPDYQKLIDEIHEYMISKASPVPQPNSLESSEPLAAATEQSCETPVSPANTNAITEIAEHEEQQHEVSLNENQEAEESRVSAQVAPVIPHATVNTPTDASETG